MSGTPTGLLAQALDLLIRADAWLTQMATERRAAGLSLAALVQLAILRALLIWSALLAVVAAGLLELIARGLNASLALLLAAGACALTAGALHLHACLRRRPAPRTAWLQGLGALLLTALLARAAQAAQAAPADPAQAGPAARPQDAPAPDAPDHRRPA